MAAQGSVSSQLRFGFAEGEDGVQSDPLVITLNPSYFREKLVQATTGRKLDGRPTATGSASNRLDVGTTAVYGRPLASLEPGLAGKLEAVGVAALAKLSKEDSLAKSGAERGKKHKDRRDKEAWAREHGKEWMLPIRKIKKEKIPTDLKLSVEYEKSARASNLSRVVEYRSSRKEEAIARMLRGQVGQSRTIEPSFGQLLFFEAVFTNPYPDRRLFTVTIKDPVTGVNRPSLPQSMEKPTAKEEYMRMFADRPEHKVAIVVIFFSCSVPNCQFV